MGPLPNATYRVFCRHKRMIVRPRRWDRGLVTRDLVFFPLTWLQHREADVHLYAGRNWYGSGFTVPMDG